MNALAFSVLLQLTTVAAGADTYETAHAESMKSGQPLVVLVGTESCSACKQMQTNVIPELKKSGAMSQVSFATVDAEKQSELAKELGTGNAVPQLVMYRKTGNGWLRSVLSGSRSSGEVKAFLSRTRRVSYSQPEVQNVARPIASYSP